MDLGINTSLYNIIVTRGYKMRMNELYDLENIISTIVPQEYQYINEKDALDLLDSLLHLMETYIEENPKAITDCDFQEDFKEHVEELFYITFDEEIKYCKEIEEDIDDLIEEAFDIFFNSMMPYRSYSDAVILYKPNRKIIDETLVKLRNKPQPTQRTNAWYEFRHNLITASNAYKAFENQNVKNQLIYEKCQPLKVVNEITCSPVNVNTTLHWGQKYEPLSVLIYEHLYDTTIEDFGCIQHDTYKFVGASPDGINVDPTKDRYGRMLEIKNIVNREINGIPKKEYWVQMQLQMEVCNLDECDFLETKFVEYESYTDYCEDTETLLSDDKFKGVIMYFSSKEGKPTYLYKPLHLTDEDDWEEEMLDKYKLEFPHLTWIKNIYWKLQKMSCVLVLRNRAWFNNNIAEMEELWRIVEKERISGYQHRAPNKRVRKDSETSLEDLSPGCLLNVNKDTNEITLVKGKNPPFIKGGAKNNLWERLC